jgi:hypothetical protein
MTTVDFFVAYEFFLLTSVELVVLSPTGPLLG